jgi:hypothetical protein
LLQKNIPTGEPIGMKKILHFLNGQGYGFAVDIPFFGEGVSLAGIGQVKIHSGMLKTDKFVFYEKECLHFLIFILK